MDLIRETVEVIRVETADQARERFWQAYLRLGQRDRELFERLVEPLVRIALLLPPAAQPRFDRSELLPWGRLVEAEARVA